MKINFRSILILILLVALVIAAVSFFSNMTNQIEDVEYINIHIGDFLETDLSALPRPDAVFIGGHGGKLKEMMAKVLTVLAPDGIIVMNSVKAPKVLTDSHLLWDEACQELGLQQEPPTKIILNENHPIEILKCKR